MKERFDETADKTAKAIMVAGATDTAQSDMMVWERGVLLSYYAKDQAGLGRRHSASMSIRRRWRGVWKSCGPC